MTDNRTYTSRREEITQGLVEVLKQINGAGHFLTDIESRAFSGLKFWDSIEDFPSIYVTAGSESRVYQGGGYKDRYLTILIRIYVREEEPQKALSALIEDVETLIEDNSSFKYYDKRGLQKQVLQSSVLSIDTDEGLLDPIGAGELLLEIHY